MNKKILALSALIAVSLCALALVFVFIPGSDVPPELTEEELAMIQRTAEDLDMSFDELMASIDFTQEQMGLTDVQGTMGAASASSCTTNYCKAVYTCYGMPPSPKWSAAETCLDGNTACLATKTASRITNIWVRCGDTN